jgi:hypothetical protein
MQHADNREATTAGPDEKRRERPEVRLDEAQVASSGGLPYQQARRAPNGSDERPSAVDPERQQVADHHGGPSSDDESWLQEQGYPKLGPKIQSRVTQHEHGPYAGGSQQGDVETRERAASSPDA